MSAYVSFVLFVSEVNIFKTKMLPNQKGIEFNIEEASLYRLQLSTALALPQYFHII